MERCRLVRCLRISRSLVGRVSIDSTNEHSLDTTVDEKGITHYNPIFSWDKERKMYLLNRNVPSALLSHVWTPCLSGKGIWYSVDEGTVPPEYFELDKLKEGLVHA